MGSEVALTVNGAAESDFAHAADLLGLGATCHPRQSDRALAISRARHRLHPRTGKVKMRGIVFMSASRTVAEVVMGSRCAGALKMGGDHIQFRLMSALRP